MIRSGCLLGAAAQACEMLSCAFDSLIKFMSCSCVQYRTNAGDFSINVRPVRLSARL